MHGCAVAQRALCELLGRFGALRVITHVMTAASIGASRGGGYARYLESKTVEPERGDYYLTPDGEMAQAPGRWLADAETLERLGVQAGEPVDGADFIALMEGRHPGTGRWLRPEGAGGGRGGGIDVTFSAPKSVSTVWALGDPWQREQIEQAHARAVEQTIRHLREQVPVVRRRYSGQVVEEHAKDVIATEYRHTTARGVQGAQAPDPQLHSHVVDHRRCPRGRPDRGGRVAADLPLRAGARRVLPLRARRRARAGGIRDRAGHRQGWPVLRDRRCPPRAVRGVLRSLA